jgi:PIN domain nuclease of toxin-antitoxin system
VDRRHVICFSVVSIWEMAIKASLGREDFHVNPPALRLGLLEQGLLELPIQVSHVLAVYHLPGFTAIPSIACWWPRPPWSG